MSPIKVEEPSKFEESKFFDSRLEPRPSLKTPAELSFSREQGPIMIEGAEATKRQMAKVRSQESIHLPKLLAEYNHFKEEK